nr:glycosyltransferase [Salinadaptatus halalkaliphilus]
MTVAGHDYADRLAEYGVDPDRIWRVFHPIDDAYRESTPVADPEYDILWLGRISPEKDPYLFIDTLTELHRRSVEFSAVLVGSGPLESDIRALISRRGLEDHVELAGWTDEQLEYYRNSRVYVLTSTREMMPLTVIEAITVGIPVVVPPLGGIPDIVDDGENGYLVPDGNPGAYADRIERVLRGEDCRLERSPKTRWVEDAGSYEAVSRSWEEILATLNH